MYRRFSEHRISTPGPSEISHAVKVALVRETTNLDLDQLFLSTSFALSKASLLTAIIVNPGGEFKAF